MIVKNVWEGIVEYILFEDNLNAGMYLDLLVNHLRNLIVCIYV